METEQSTEERMLCKWTRQESCIQEPDAEKFSLKDPKDSDLFLIYLKPRETLVEELRRSDVQIDAANWEKGRKTHRAV